MPRFTVVQSVLIAAPVALAACLVARYGVDVPFWDEWTIAEFLQKIDGGTLTASALLSQHNEHRMLVPRIIQLVVAFGVGWDTRILMWLSQGLLLAGLSGCVVLWRRSLAHRATWPATISLALVALLLFSPAQHQNLLWGFRDLLFHPRRVPPGEHHHHLLSERYARSVACSCIGSVDHGDILDSPGPPDLAADCMCSAAQIWAAPAYGHGEMVSLGCLVQCRRRPLLFSL